MTAKEVSHVEDDCPLGDGFERESTQPSKDPVHVHFCVLHATYLELTEHGWLTPEPDYSTLALWGGNAGNPFAYPIDHPPQA